jgi:hypothetical protein
VPEPPPSEKLRALPRVPAWFHRAEQQPLFDWTSGRLMDRLCREAHPLRISDLQTSPPSRISAPQTLHPLAPFRRFDLRVLGSSFHHRNCEAGNAFAATNRSEALGTIAFHRDRCANCARKPFGHFIASWRQLWSLAHNSGIDIAGLKSRFAHKSRNLGEKPDAVSACPFRVGVGKVLADIAEASGPKQRIGACMGHDISVAVAH